MRFLMSIFYRKVYTHDFNKLPKNRPILLASNHPNSFIDALLFCLYVDQKVYSIARGDVFANPIARFMLGQVNILPIFRRRDGVKNMHKNKATFEMTMDLFRDNNIVLIFSEGLCVVEKRLRRLRRGTAQMALQAAFDHNLPIALIPAGVNYTYPTKWREDVMVNVDDEIPLEPYRELYTADPAKAIGKLTNDLEARMKKLIIHINSEESEELCETLFEIGRSDFKVPSLPALERDDARYLVEKSIANKVNSIELENPDLLEAIKQQAKNYNGFLTSNKLRDAHIHHQKKISFLKIFAYLLLTITLAPIALLGLIPFLIAVKLSDKITDLIEFKASLYFAISYLFYWIAHNVLFVGTWVAWGIFPALLTFFGLHLVIILGWRILEALIFQLKLLKVRRLQRTKNSTLAQALNLRNELKEVAGLR